MQDPRCKHRYLDNFSNNVILMTMMMKVTNIYNRRFVLKITEELILRNIFL